MNLNLYAKAITAAITAGLGAILLAVGAGSDGGTGITVDEWVKIAVAIVGAGGLTWGVPNTIGALLTTSKRGPDDPPLAARLR